jgi:hypothetical protein
VPSEGRRPRRWLQWWSPDHGLAPMRGRRRGQGEGREPRGPSLHHEFEGGSIRYILVFSIIVFFHRVLYIFFPLLYIYIFRHLTLR